MKGVVTLATHMPRFGVQVSTTGLPNCGQSFALLASMVLILGKKDKQVLAIYCSCISLISSSYFPLISD